MIDRDPFEGLTPSFSDLAFLKSKLPALKRAGQSKGRKLFVPKGMVDPVPCLVCGFIFDRYNMGSEPKHQNCPKCRQKLENGYAVAVCRVNGEGLYDGRFAWLVPGDTVMAQKMRGQVIPVDARMMDMIELKSRLADLKPEQIIMKCSACGIEAVGDRDNDEPEACSLVSWPCKNCRTENDLNAKYFDRNLNPVA